MTITNAQIESDIDGTKTAKPGYKQPAGFGVPTALVRALRNLFNKTSYDTRTEQLEFVGKGTAATATMGTTVIGEAFTIGDDLRLTWDPPLDFDPEQDITLTVSWAPDATEGGQLISWTTSILAKGSGSFITATSGAGVTVADEAMPATLGSSTDSVFLIESSVHLTGKVVEVVHIILSRIASSNDPASAEPVVHNVIIEYGVK